ncbi:MAG: hypothetical protein NTZ82_04425, partial [Bacteroidetes bacterium]|nr:hypothetical protein [Bacteroidota bacterium]
EQLLAGIPYVFFILLVKYFIEQPYLQLAIISVLSISWFFILHFILLQNSIIKQEFLLFFKKDKTKAPLPI